MGHSFQSPLRRWEVLAGLAQQMNAKTFVEVGCKEGRTTGFILANLPDIRVIAIDTWAPMPNADEDYEDWDFNKIRNTFWENVGNHKDRCEMWMTTSAAAAYELTSGRPMTDAYSRVAFSEIMTPGKDPQCDICFIDAGHDYDNALADIKAWWPLVREGGYLCGHDYQHKFPGVMRAVAKSFPLLRVAVCPDSVWVVQKDADVRMVA
jgi:methyltransferase family protein